MREPAALVTFDDGYRDNFEVAVPILRERERPGDVLPTHRVPRSRRGCRGGTRWPTRSNRPACRRSGSSGAANGDAPPLSIDLEAMPRLAAIMTIIRAFLDDTIADERWFLDQLFERAEVAVDGESLARRLFTSWDQVRQTRRRGQ